MNADSIKKVLPHLQVATVLPTNISIKVNTELGGAAGGGIFPSTFSRFRWACDENGYHMRKGDDANPTHMLVITVDTLTEIAIKPEAGPTPEGEDIPENALIATIEVTLAVTYLCNIEPELLDKEGVSEFAQFNVPYHFWPYWRELIQSLAIRTQIPLPHLPPYVVPAAAQKQ